MRKTLLVAAGLLPWGLFLGGAAALAQSTTQPAIPASATTAVTALQASTRHGEWDDIPLPGSDVKIHTWVVYPERSDKAPVVLVIHEIFGMSDWVRATTDQVAAEGYIAVAPDFLSGKGPNGGGTESFGGDATSAVSKLKANEEASCLDAVRAYAIALPSATDKTATIGFCWGGGVSFMYATHQPKLNAAVVFYGPPPAKDAMANITCPVLGLYGKDDARITSMIPGAQQAMTELNKSYDPHIFDGAGHGFMRQQEGRNGANLKAAQQGWGLAMEFLKKNLK
jgi:carboxymethylenebutenolidase